MVTAGLAAGGEVAAQFRAGTALVLVDVVATRLDGQPARDLTRADFEVLEDGRPQEIRQFDFVDLERPLETVTDPPGVFSNRAESGAVFALVLDDMMVAARHTRPMQAWARRFLDEQVRPGDMVSVTRTGGDSPLLLASDARFFDPVIAAASGRGGGTDLSSLTGATGEALPTPGGEAPQMPDFTALGLFDSSPAARIDAEQSLATLQRVVEYLAGIPARRKAVVLFSQGVAFDLEAFAGNETSRTFDTMRRLLAAAREGNVAIYTVDPRGLQGSQDPAIGATPVPVTADRGLDTLRDLATATGGRAIVATNQIDSGFARIATDNRAYYLIGYEPRDTDARPRARTIEVRTRAPGVSLLHRKAYAPATGAARPAARPMTSALPVSGLPVTMAPALFPDPKAGVALAVPFELGENLPAGVDVGYTLVAVDPRGRQTSRLTGRVPAAGGSARGMVRLQLTPGRYQLRLHAESERGEGVALASVTVPEGGAVVPQCGRFLVLQPENGAPRPTAARRVRGDQPMILTTVISAGDAFASAALELVVTTADGASRVIPVSPPQPVGRGLWRVEMGVPAGTIAGAAELTLMAGKVALADCRTGVNPGPGRDR